ncbi:flagellar biosynthesis protein FlhF [Alkalibacter mobilis]|uniref:flagellar biosynthesis protein FlhF n=1 Tax=Alkalibacter mobilis TaxID=2787712 RepID=UPI00189E801D|nr:AAA family ATPase [Alkalibacter mobilis]MBF7096305.1 AAA family ATPase [Alkalibacter mobilis]
MIIKRYIVNDMREALVRAKYELGKDAIIISQKTVKPGKWYNPFRKKKFEVTIAIEDEIHEKNKTEKEAINKILFEKSRKSTEKATVEKTEKSKGRHVFGNHDSTHKRWKDYCDRNAISENEVDYEKVRNFISEMYMENAYLKELGLCKINVFVGPTGVGKTTTMAKIASKEYLHNDKKVGLITIDTYRIAAVEQLRKYAKIMGIACETVNEPSEMKSKIQKLKDCDLILIDTVGASPRSEDRIEDVKAYVDQIEGEKNTYLTLSMSTDVDTNNAVLKTYRSLSYNGIILTKFDEVRNYNNFWNMMENNVLPIQYFCYGQNVPEDIEESSLENVLSYLWRELINE